MRGGLESSPHWRALGVPLFYTLLFCSLFSPVLLSGRVLAPGDGILGYLPAFRSSHALWEPRIGAGFPLAADGSSQPYYPPAMLASRLGAWNALVVAAYVIAASGTCGLVFELTGSAFAALFSGIVFGMSGFLIIHLPHLSQIHAAAWVPLALWAFERLRLGPSRAWFLIAVLAVACGALAGHPQNFVNGFSLAGAYVACMGFGAPIGPRRYWTWIAGAFCLGLGIAAAQWIPMLELGRLSHRPQLDFETFVSFSLPARQTAQLFFPFLFGGASETGPYAPTYYGKWNLGELVGYVGFLPWTAALLAMLRHPERRQVRFWSAAALLAFALALGADTPLASLVFHLPPYNRLRCPARHLLELTLAIAVLSGLGIAALERRGPGARALAGRVALGVLAASLFLLALSLFGSSLVPAAEAWAKIAATLSRPAVLVPLSFGALSVPAVVFYASNPNARRAAALALLAVLDLGSFAWFADWRVRAPDPGLLTEPAWLAGDAKRLRSENQRLVSFHPASMESAMPNITWLWDAPNAAVYPQLAVGRQRDLLPLVNGFASFCPDDRALDLLAVRYAPRPRVRRFGFDWEPADDQGCGAGERAWELPNVPATRVGLVAALGNSLRIADGALVATLEVENEGDTLRLPIRAGEHVSEWAYDRADVRPKVRHRRAPVFESIATVDDDFRPFQFHRYLADLDLGGRREVRRLTLRPEPRVSVRVDHVSLADGERSQPVASGLLDPRRWRLARMSDHVLTYENLRAMPRAWLVDRTVKLDPQAILRAVRTSRLPDGSEFDPRAVALVEEDIDGAGASAASSPPPSGEVDQIRIEDESVELRTRAPGPRVLVLSDVYYPGWRAAIDGSPTRVHQVDYALRGVAVPAGVHRVRFEFKPTSFRAGAAISLASLVVVLVLAGLVVSRRSDSLAVGDPR